MTHSHPKSIGNDDGQTHAFLVWFHTLFPVQVLLVATGATHFFKVASHVYPWIHCGCVEALHECEAKSNIVPVGHTVQV